MNERGTRKEGLHFSNALHLRRWVVYNTVAPSLKFDGFREDTWDDSDTYLPFSVKPDHKLTQEEVFRIHRDFYQGTPFDITKSAVGGPFGDPYRGTALPDESPFNDSEEWNGTFERSVAQVRGRVSCGGHPNAALF